MGAVVTEMVAGGLWPHELWFNYFASGSNHEGEILGLAWTGRNVGVAVDALDKAGKAEAALLGLKGERTLVFVDSGAFGEVDATLKVKKPITDEEWETRLACYDRLAPLGEQLFVVAPDRVGCQETTLARLTKYAERMRALRAKGVRVIVPLQRGALTSYEFDVRVREILGFADYVRGIPSKKGAATPELVAELANGLWLDAAVPKPVRVHLLGMGPNADRYEAMAAAVMFNLPGTAPVLIPGLTTQPTLTCDSVRIMALVGKNNGPGGGPRPITKAREEVLAEAAARGEELTVTETKHRTLFRVNEAEDEELTAASTDLGWFPGCR